MSERHERIVKSFNDFNIDRMDVLDQFYHPEVRFLDPLGEITGLEALKSYYKNMYQNVKSIRFDFAHSVANGDNHMVTWTMIYAVDALNGGEPISIEGTSDIRFDPATNLVIYHRDYFDMGAMVYEYIPVLGRLIRYIKSKFEH